MCKRQRGLVGNFKRTSRTQKLVKKGKRKIEESVCKEFISSRRQNEFRKVHMRKSTNKVQAIGVVPGRVWRAKAASMVPTQTEVSRRQLARSLTLHGDQLSGDRARVGVCSHAPLRTSGLTRGKGDRSERSMEQTSVGSHVEH